MPWGNELWGTGGAPQGAARSSLTAETSAVCSPGSPAGRRQGCTWGIRSWLQGSLLWWSLMEAELGCRIQEGGVLQALPKWNVFHTDHYHHLNMLLFKQNTLYHTETGCSKWKVTLKQIQENDLIKSKLLPLSACGSARGQFCTGLTRERTSVRALGSRDRKGTRARTTLPWSHESTRHSSLGPACPAPGVPEFRPSPPGLQTGRQRLREERTCSRSHGLDPHSPNPLGTPFWPHKTWLRRA